MAETEQVRRKWIATIHEALTDEKTRRLCGEMLGFTHEDVEMVRWAEGIMMREDIFGFADPKNSARFRSLADRIQALLPPEKP